MNMTQNQKADAITLWLTHKSEMMDNVAVMRMNIFALEFVGSDADAPFKVRMLHSYWQLPFRMGDGVIKEMINHPCEPLKVTIVKSILNEGLQTYFVGYANLEDDILTFWDSAEEADYNSEEWVQIKANTKEEAIDKYESERNRWLNQ